MKLLGDGGVQYTYRTVVYPDGGDHLSEIFD